MKLSKCQNYIKTFIYKDNLNNYWNKNLYSINSPDKGKNIIKELNVVE